MDRVVSAREPVRMTYTASQEVCPSDDAKLWVVQHRARTVHRLDESIEATFRDKACPRDGCAASGLRFRPAEESMLALPGSSFGLDVLVFDPKQPERDRYGRLLAYIELDGLDVGAELVRRGLAVADERYECGRSRDYRRLMRSPTGALTPGARVRR